ncbi:hypothetical protein KA005_69510 [bacterium]|nr:hypothetical protein [bacterium]
MEQAIQLFGYLILTILGFVLPIVAILLSVYQEGMSKLAQQYKEEVSQSEENLKTIAKSSKTDLAAIQQSINELESIKKKARIKLSYLNPRGQIIRLFIPLVFAFLGVVATSILIGTSFYYSLFLLLSLAGFVYALIVLWKLVGIITEVRRIIDADKKDMDSKTIELLSALVEKVEKTGEYYLKRVHITLEGKDIKDNSTTTTMQVNVKQELKIGIQNHETVMAKNIEIGFDFPSKFIIEKTSGYSIYREEGHQIIRSSENMLHGATHLHLSSPMIITPLEQGNYTVDTFIKAENIESTYRTINFKVT